VIDHQVLFAPQIQNGGRPPSQKKRIIFYISASVLVNFIKFYMLMHIDPPDLEGLIKN